MATRFALSRDKFRHALACFSFAGLFACWWNAGYFGYELLAEIAIFAILAMSLDFIAGFGGLVSLGHAALFGCGAYLYALFTLIWQVAPWLSMLAAIMATAIIAFAVALVIVRIRGIFFIIMTLALGSIGYEFIFKNRTLGGDDGFGGLPRLDLSALNIDSGNAAQFCLLLLIVSVLVYGILVRLIGSPFGSALQASKDNAERMQILGLAVHRQQVIAFTIAGALAGLAGVLSAQHSQFISPQLLHWTTSGEVLIMVILGGLQSLVGAIIGAILLVFLRHEISAYTDYWGFFLGLFLLATVISGKAGIVGFLENLCVRDKAARHVTD